MWVLNFRDWFGASFLYCTLKSRLETTFRVSIHLRRLPSQFRSRGKRRSLAVTILLTNQLVGNEVITSHLVRCKKSTCYLHDFPGCINLPGQKTCFHLGGDLQCSRFRWCYYLREHIARTNIAHVIYSFTF